MTHDWCCARRGRSSYGSFCLHWQSSKIRHSPSVSIPHYTMICFWENRSPVEFAATVLRSEGSGLGITEELPSCSLLLWRLIDSSSWLLWSWFLIVKTQWRPQLLSQENSIHLNIEAANSNDSWQLNMKGDLCLGGGTLEHLENCWNWIDDNICQGLSR